MKVRNQADPFRSLYAQMPAEAPGEVKNVHVLEGNPILAEHDSQARHVRPLRLGEFIHIGLAERDSPIAVRSQKDLSMCILESSQAIHPLRSKQFAQQLNQP